MAGTQEPIYGPSAIQSVAEQVETTPYTELTKDGFKWEAMDSTSVETQSFYLMADSGHIALAQVIYSNVAYGSSRVLARNSTDHIKAEFVQLASSIPKFSIQRARTNPTCGPPTNSRMSILVMIS